MRHGLRVTSAVALIVGVTATSALATTARKMSNRDLAEQSEIVLIGKAVDSRSAWEGRTLVTLVTVEVTEALKGDPGPTITVALPGGIDANRRIPIGMTFAGAPAMKPGEDVFLFLTHDTDIASGYIVNGFSQGKFSILRDPSGRAVVSRDLTQILLESGPGIARGAVTYTALADFRAEILEYLK